MIDKNIWKQGKRYIYDGIPVGITYRTSTKEQEVPAGHICVFTSDGVYATSHPGWVHVEPAVYERIVPQVDVIDPDTGRSPVA